MRDAELFFLALTTGLGKYLSGARALPPGAFRDVQGYLEQWGLPLEALLHDDALIDSLPISAGNRTRLCEVRSTLGQVETEYAMLHSMGAHYVAEHRPEYPPRLRLLGRNAPPVFFYYGDIALAHREGIAAGGSRRIRNGVRRACWHLGKQCAREELALYCGGAKGVDMAMETENLQAGGHTITILPDGFLRNPLLRNRRMIADNGRQLFISCYHPTQEFTAYGALYRNHMIYCMGKIALTMAAQDGSGGGYAGARDNLRGGWSRQYVFLGDHMPPGNAALVAMGAKPLHESRLYAPEFSLRNMMEQENDI